MNGNQFLTQTANHSLIFIILGFLVHFLTKLLKFEHHGVYFKKPDKTAIYSFAALFSGVIIVSLLLIFSVTYSQSVGLSSTSIKVFSFSSVIKQLTVAALFYTPIFLTMAIRRESFASAGVSTHNLVKSIFTGLILSLIFVTIILSNQGKNPLETVSIISVTHLFALSKYAIVGFGEEFAFRGYLQTRFSALFGKWTGWIIASILMALVHVIQRFLIEGMTLPEAFISSFMLIPISLLLGYIMIRTENIVAPALFHTFVDWVNIFR